MADASALRRTVIGSQGNEYTVWYFGDRWRCSCIGYAKRKRCWHAAALDEETREKEQLIAAAADFLNGASPGAAISSAAFLLTLGNRGREVSAEACHAVLAVVLESYRRVCGGCNGAGGENHVVGGRDEPITEGYRCTHCDGEGVLEPPRLTPLEDSRSIAAA